MINVVSKKSHFPVKGEIDVYIGRPSPLGNPYPVTNGRDKCIAQYQSWFDTQILTKGKARNEIIQIYRLVKAGHKVNLVCWCAPQACHGDVIKSFLEEYL